MVVVVGDTEAHSEQHRLRRFYCIATYLVGAVMRREGGSN